MFRRKPEQVRVLWAVLIVLEVLLAGLIIAFVLRVTHDYRDRNETPSSSHTESLAPETTEPPASDPESTEEEPVTEPIPPTDVPTEKPTEKPTERPTQMPTERPTENPTERPTEKPTEPSESHPYPVNENTSIEVPSNAERIFLGDSRFLGMKLYTDHDKEKDGFITGGGEGYNWLVRTAIPAIREIISSGVPIEKVYLNLGVNDCAYTYKDGNRFLGGDYSLRFNELADEFPDVRFYFISVGPSSGERYGGVEIAKLNDEVDAFNYYIFSHCPDVEYVAAGEYLQRTGFVSSDGIHYNKATYQKLYDFIIKETYPE
ncbi:MAG: hypothetical protein J5794_09405 [Lachnospiraceae bacterium]|nr:hypothetical protein [Lachnospiraceae bacterium]